MERMTWPKSVTAHLTSRCIVSRWHMANPPLLNLCHRHKRLALAEQPCPSHFIPRRCPNTQTTKEPRGALISPIYTCQMGEGCTPECVPRRRHAPLERAEVLVSACHSIPLLPLQQDQLVPDGDEINAFCSVRGVL